MSQLPPDERLWKIARKRASFKKHFTSYFLVILFLWAIWWFTTERRHIYTGAVPWPVWPMLAWGLAIAFNYFDAYGSPDRQSAVEKEFEKLKAERERQGAGGTGQQ